MKPAASEKWAALPLGELHSENRCALCGTLGREDLTLRRTVLALTRAMCHICVDTTACEHRRYEQRRKVG